jgi:hypothetical protein
MLDEVVGVRNVHGVFVEDGADDGVLPPLPVFGSGGLPAIL